MLRREKYNLYYFYFFIGVSLFYIINGYAILGTNDDWALWGMLRYKGIYGTLIMSYPMSFIISKLYDFFPSFPWYSSFLSLIILLNFYLISKYISELNSIVYKILILAISTLLLSYFWLNVTITGLTALTMLSAIGLINKNLKLSFILMFLAFLLRSDIMYIFIPYYIVSYFILKKKIKINKDEFITLFIIIILICISIFIQNQDKFYMNWLAFNKARSAIVDLGILNVDKNYFSLIEKFCYQTGWLQDPQLLSSEKLISTTPSLSNIFLSNIKNININFFIFHKFKYWLWLLLGASLIALIYTLKDKRFFFLLLLVFGILLLITIRDVERVTSVIVILWIFILFEVLKKNVFISSFILIIFTYIFYGYMYNIIIPQKRYIDYSKTLQKEAKKLIKSSKKSCEISVNFPTNPSNELNIVCTSNYLFHENGWLEINDKEILPTGWLVRNRFFYETHNLSDKIIRRKYRTYHDFLVDDNTAFFGSNSLSRYKTFNLLLKTYDKLYLKDKPECKHITKIIKHSKHFSISQIKIICNKQK